MQQVLGLALSKGTKGGKRAAATVSPDIYHSHPVKTIIRLLCHACFLLPSLLMCTPENTAGTDALLVYPGMISLHSKNDSVYLGTSDTLFAQSDERPQSVSRFTYDFALDSTEVTVKSYRELMGSLPREYDSTGPVDEMSPVTYVSWFDAILYCNMRSNSENLDSVYSFLSAERTAAGNIYGLVGLSINYRRNGYGYRPKLPDSSSCQWEHLGINQRCILS